MISPLLLNIALQGIEEAAGTRYYKSGKTVPGTPAVIVYADDLVALCHSRRQAEAVRERLARWLEPKGLRFNEHKTRIVPVTDGFDFLSFSIRRYRTKDGGKVLTKPSKEALTKIRRRMKAELRALRGMPAAVIDRLNPVIRGQAAYYRTPIVRHAPVTGRSSPDDPALAQYWADRRRRQKRKNPPLAPATERAVRAQDGRCPLCGEPLLYADRPPDSPGQ